MANAWFVVRVRNESRRNQSMNGKRFPLVAIAKINCFIFLFYHFANMISMSCYIRCLLHYHNCQLDATPHIRVRLSGFPSYNRSSRQPKGKRGKAAASFFIRQLLRTIPVYAANMANLSAFVPVCQQIRFHTLAFPPFRRPVPGRPPGLPFPGTCHFHFRCPHHLRKLTGLVPIGPEQIHLRLFALKQKFVNLVFNIADNVFQLFLKTERFNAVFHSRGIDCRSLIV